MTTTHIENYKDTLNLPKTDFPMKANLAQREPARLKAWKEINLYKRLREHCAGRKKFILHDGPPYANGHIHLGHAVNKTLKDLIMKSKTLSGFDTPYVPGWDCHGLPIELNVEKKVGKAGEKISAKEFREKCRAYAESQITLQSEDFQRLSVVGDWDNPYKTMNFRYEANIIRALSKIIQGGFLTRGRKPVHWCVDCHSALAEAEVEYKDKTSPSIDVCFEVVDAAAVGHALSAEVSGLRRICIPIWTTTPWTLPANQAVALNPGLNYVLVKQDNDALLIAEMLLEPVCERLGITKIERLGECKGQALDKVLLQHPFYDRQVPVIMGHHVTTETGTGAVHTAPAHGLDDYWVCMEYGLPIDNPVDHRGCYKDDTEFFAGEHVFKANTHVIEILKEKGALLHHETVTHSYPHCWRHKTPLIFRATPQWFLSLEEHQLRQKALDALDDTEWLPAWGSERMRGMIEQHPGWCLSRQRAWGTPMTLFVHKDTDALHPDMVNLIERVAERVEQGGIEAWFDLDPKELLGDDADNYHKSTDVLDVWFDAGASHACVLDVREEQVWPADVYLEGSDQHRGWFQSSLLEGVALYGKAPFRKVVTHGFTVDPKGHKMSKSLGNVVPPSDVINKYGADVLRLWVASTDYTSEMTYSEEIMKHVAESYRRIRNTARFLLANTHDFNFETDAVPADQLLALDRWVMARTRALQTELCAAYDAFQFHTVSQKLAQFCSVELGGFYLDVIKDRQYTMAKDSLGRRSAQTVMYHLLEAMVRWLAPVCTFTAEEIWSHMSGQRDASVLMATWYDAFPAVEQDAFDADFWLKALALRDEVNKCLEAARTQRMIGSALDAHVDLFVDDTWAQRLASLDDELRFLLITSEVVVKPLAEKTDAATQTALPEVWVAVSACTHEKCARCWHKRKDVGQDKAHPALCGRCVTNVLGEGEVRRYA